MRRAATPPCHPGSRDLSGASAYGTIASAPQNGRALAQRFHRECQYQGLDSRQSYEFTHEEEADVTQQSRVSHLQSQYVENIMQAQVIVQQLYVDEV